MSGKIGIGSVLLVGLFRQLCWLVPIVAICGCGENAAYEELPQPIKTFIAMYYSEVGVEQYQFTDSTYTVTLQNSAMLTFDAELKWCAIDGRGSILPDIFLFDEMPSHLYQYLQSTANLDEVYAAERTATTITLRLLDSVIAYELATERITYLVNRW
jgi:hypothetical protein